MRRERPFIQEAERTENNAEYTSAPVILVLVDDTGHTRQGIRILLDCDPDIKLIGEARIGDEVFSLMTRLQPDTLILDARLGVDHRALLAATLGCDRTPLYGRDRRAEGGRVVGLQRAPARGRLGAERCFDAVAKSEGVRARSCHDVVLLLAGLDILESGLDHLNPAAVDLSDFSDLRREEVDGCSGQLLPFLS